MNLFKGYIKTKNKIPTKKGKFDIKTLEQVQSLQEYAGVLNDDVILIDIDDAEQAEILMDIVEEKQLNCRVYQTTRGKHFLFRNNGIDKNGNGVKLACGLMGDIKLGSKNGYEVLKINGEERFIEWDYSPYDEVPKWLFPVKTNLDFLTMEAGDGRNQSLFNYILTLQSTDFTVEEARETIRIINQYILKDPLSEKELETILRDDAFKKPIFFKGTSFLFDKFAIYLKNNNYILKINNQLHIYKNGVYVPGFEEIEAEMIKHIPSLNRAKRNEVLAYLNIMIRDNTPVAGAHLIAFRNGVYNLKDNTFNDFTPNIVMTNKINWNYNPNAYYELTDKTLNNIACHDVQIRLLLEEMIGYCMFRRNELGKAFILTGSGSNGKSTFLDMLKTLLGDDNYSSLDLKQFTDRFSTIRMFGKLANIGDDISSEFVVDPSEFKKIVTGESIEAEQKGQPKFQFKPYAKLLFSANSIPRIGKGRDSAALLRRLVIVPFNANFKKTNADFNPFISDELRTQESIEYLIKLGLEGLQRVLENHEFTQSVQTTKELEEYEEMNNPILGFIKEIDRDEIENEPTKDIYKRYQVYCSENNFQSLSNIEFSKQIKKHFDLEIISKRIDGKVERIFVGRE